MTFSSPEWLFLIPALIALGWRRRDFKLHEPLRAIGLLMLVLALSGPQLRLASAGLDLWVLADRSDSNAVQIARQSPEIEGLLERSRGSRDRIFYVDYAGDSVRREIGDPVFDGENWKTRTGAALQYTLGQMEPGRAARFLVLTDGYATEPMGPAIDQVLRSGIPLDYRLIGETPTEDWRVTGVAVSPRVLAGESFMVDIEVTGPAEGTADVDILRSGKVAMTTPVKLSGGVGHVNLTDRIPVGGAVRYEARVKPAKDAHPENNIAGAWVEVVGGPKIVLVTNYADDPLVNLLTAQGLSVEKVLDAQTLNPGILAGAKAVVIHNVPASKVAPEFLAGLDFFVREQGGGLLMVGGKNSFGTGGYFKSAIDELLPVTMELKKDQNKLMASIAIAMDRSGSMGASAGNGMRKIDLADAGTARAVELMGDMDSVSVHAVDVTAHEIVPLSSVGPNRTSIIDTVRTINTSGGGIVVMNALTAAWDQLKNSSAGTRHIILFADARDSAQQLGDYQSLARDIRADNITISVIGMGSEFDQHAGILEEIAKIGEGRIFFSADANDLPAVFAQETVAVARSAFLDRKTPTEATAGWAEIAARAPKWLKEVDAYNLTYLKPDATASLITIDDNRAPLVATWQRGIGRVSAVTFPLGGNGTELIRAWPDYGDFVQTLGRWLAGEEAPAGMALRTEVDGERLKVSLYYDPGWNAKIAQTPPTVMLVETAPGSSQQTRRELVWEKIQPGLFIATSMLVPNRLTRGVVRVGDSAMSFGPLTVSGSAEWSFNRDRLAELRDLSLRSGGAERLDLTSVWRAPRPIAWRDIRPWLLALWLLLFLADAALTRLGIPLLPKGWRVAEA